MNKVTAIDLSQDILIGEDIRVKAYYAGHVLGAAMFHVQVGGESVLYTGDYNMTRVVIEHTLLLGYQHLVLVPALASVFLTFLVKTIRSSLTLVFGEVPVA